MSHRKAEPDQQDGRGIQVISDHSSRGRLPGESENQPVATLFSVRFQLVANIVVEAERATESLLEPDLDSTEHSLFLTVLATPEALRRICRLAIVCDLTEDSERYFQGKLIGPEPEDILDSILPYLPADRQIYWTELQRENSDCFDFCIVRIFQQFRSSWRNTEIIDMVTGESTHLWSNGRLAR